jgi:hypothetical protein
MANNLRSLLNDRNWNAADLVRAAARHMPEVGRFAADNASNFINGKRKPTRPFVIAMGKALGIEPEAFMPAYFLAEPVAGEATAPLLTQVPGKRDVYRVFIDREMTLKNALLIVEALDKIEHGDAS